MSRRAVRWRFTAAAAALAFVLGGCATVAPVGPAGLAPVQAELFAEAGSLANAWGDFDSDGDPDLAVSLKSGEIRLYRNDAGVFSSVGASLGLPQSGPEMRGLSWGDYDADGDIDLLGGATRPDSAYLVFRNDAGRSFTNVAGEIGLALTGRSARQTNWVDYDGDGDLDVYAANRIGKNTLLKNEGGRFAPAFPDAGDAPGIDDARPTVGACWFDYDRDGDLDVFLANQSGATDALWRNDQGGFTDVAPALAIHSPGRPRTEGGVGCAIGDYDNDGDFDIFLAAYGPNKLFRNNGDATFTDVAGGTPLGAFNKAVGAAWGDADNDGDLDLFIAAYEGDAPNQTPKGKLYRNDGPGGFVNVLADDMPANAGDHGVEWVDADGDGDLDLSLTDGYGAQGGHPLFRNPQTGRLAGRSLKVLVLDAQGRFTQAGAEVRLRDASGAVIASRQVSTGGGYNTQSALPVHFGLARHGAYRLEVTFMTAGGPKVQTIPVVRTADHAGRVYTVRMKP